MTEPTLPPTNKDGSCTNCGEAGHMTLAQDFTEYSPCELVKGEWVETYSHSQESDADTARRFFCANCGTPHQVPENIQ